MSVFEQLTYKDILKRALLEKKSRHGAKGFTFQKMAEHCRVQKTYLSKVLSRDGHLTSDQLFLACEYLGLNKEETEFTALLYEHERSQIERRKEGLANQIRTTRRAHHKTESHIKGESITVTSEAMAIYHLDPYLPIVHIFLTVDKFGKNPNEIANALDISKQKLADLIKKLEGLRIIQFKDGRYRSIVDNIHLKPDSPIFPAYRNLMRLKSLQQIEKLGTDQSYNFSVVFSTTPDVKDKIQKEFLELLSKSQKWIGNANETAVYQMNFDLFNWSE